MVGARVARVDAEVRKQHEHGLLVLFGRIFDEPLSLLDQQVGDVPTLQVRHLLGAAPKIMTALILKNLKYLFKHQMESDS